MLYSVNTYIVKRCNAVHCFSILWQKHFHCRNLNLQIYFFKFFKTELFKYLSLYINIMCVCMWGYYSVFLICLPTSDLICPKNIISPLVLNFPYHISSIPSGLKYWNHHKILPSFHLCTWYHRIKEVGNRSGLEDTYVSTTYLRMFRKQLHSEENKLKYN